MRMRRHQSHAMGESRARPSSGGSVHLHAGPVSQEHVAPTVPSAERPIRGIEMPRVVDVLRTSTPRMSHLAVRASARAYGSATATHRRLPDYLIIGAKKGGTSSLINWLLQHPDCLRMFPPVQRLKSAD